MAGAKSSSPETEEILSGIPTVVKYGVLGLICVLAFSIRLFAVVRYESVIHEFDPYFNFRASKYLAHEGFLEFLNWFDDRGWYPLGRTIGGTIYPGLMLTAAILYWGLNLLHITVNIRNICVFIAPLFSANAAIASYLLTTEVTKRSAAGLLAAAFTAIVPSYISRSVGGSYDNEGVAIFALIFTFYLWVKAVNTGSPLWSCIAALSYYYMVAAWGGYVFIINVIPIYVLVMILAGRYSSRLYIAYSVFYTLGSLMAMTVPFVGFNVINQAECAASHGVFIAIQMYAALSYIYSIMDAKVLRGLMTVVAGVFVGVVALGLIYLQLQGDVQWSGRSLTLLDPTYASKYIPIIASVSEHQPTTWTSFFFDLHVLVPLAPVGLFVLYSNVSDGGIFLIIYGTLAWYFAGVMVRLMLTLAPIACILAAVGVSSVLTHFSALIKTSSLFNFSDEEEEEVEDDAQEVRVGSTIHDKISPAELPKKTAKKFSGLSPSLSLIVLAVITATLTLFNYHSSYVSSMAYSSPSIVIDAGTTSRGERILFDDYREAYYWLRQNTHPDSKILSWWDYGYQMSAMANRTVLVDNNTWNNTHIATVGRALASTEEDAYPIMESLDVDYVLVIFGGLVSYSSDDINKFLWPVRIGKGVFPDDVPAESDFYNERGQYDVSDTGSPVLLNSLIYKLSYYRFNEVQTSPNVPAGYDRVRNRQISTNDISLSTMEEAFTSENWIVRIYKVKPRDEFDSPFTPNQNSSSKKSAPKAPPKKVESKKDKRPDPELVKKFQGCSYTESMFIDKKYLGGNTALNLRKAIAEAKKAGKNFVALARGESSGHAFAFNDFTEAELYDIDDCMRPCADEQGLPCGCSDSYCMSPIPEGETTNRRWAVYSV